MDAYHWIKEEEMLDLVAIAQSSPGAIAVNGAIVATLGCILPSCIIVTLLLPRKTKINPVSVMIIAGFLRVASSIL